MLDVLKETALALLRSKKFLSAFAGIAASVIVHFTSLASEAATELSMQIVGVTAVLIAGQGIADHGKEKAAREAEGVLEAISHDAATKSMLLAGATPEDFFGGEVDEDEEDEDLDLA